MNKCFLSILLCFLLPHVSYADPSPFGLEIGKATISTVQAKYRTTHSGNNKYSQGEMYELDVNQINIDGLQSATAIFDKQKKLVAILTSFPKRKFKFLFNTMKKKYTLVEKNIPFVGDTSAKFRNNQSLIFLNSPHLSFKMSVNYVDKGFWKKYQTVEKKEAQNKKKAEQSKL